MTTTKYAVDLTNEDTIIDRKTGRTVVIDWIDEIQPGYILVYGFFEDDGTDWTRNLDPDSRIKVLDHGE
jgi:hypothetical protein